MEYQTVLFIIEWCAVGAMAGVVAIVLADVLDRA